MATDSIDGTYGVALVGFTFAVLYVLRFRRSIIVFTSLLLLAYTVACAFKPVDTISCPQRTQDGYDGP